MQLNGFKYFNLTLIILFCTQLKSSKDCYLITVILFIEYSNILQFPHCCIVSHNFSDECCIAPYIYIYKYMRNIIKHNDNFNERTNTLLYKNIPLILYFRKGDVSCVWEVSWRRGQTAIWPKFFFDHNSTSFSSWLGLFHREVSVVLWLSS